MPFGADSLESGRAMRGRATPKGSVRDEAELLGERPESSLHVPNQPCSSAMRTTLVRESLQLLIRSEGWQPETFASPQEFLRRSPVAVANRIVLDVCLSNLNSFDLQKRLVIERVGSRPKWLLQKREVRVSTVPTHYRMRSMKWKSIIEWYRILRGQCQWPVFEAIRYALWLSR